MSKRSLNLVGGKELYQLLSDADTGKIAEPNGEPLQSEGYSPMLPEKKAGAPIRIRRK